jgi:hypothetical protein
MRIEAALAFAVAVTACAASHPFAPSDAAADDGPSSDGAGTGDDASASDDSSADDGGGEAAWSGGVPCGAGTCAAGDHYCLLYVPDAGSTPEAGVLSSTCVSFPPACQSTPTCACIEPLAPCGSNFAGCVQAGGVAVTCTKP